MHPQNRWRNPFVERVKPFEIAVVESMVSGCVLIAHSGEMSGSWVDVLERGKYGVGFRTIDDLAKNTDWILGDDVLFICYSKKSLQRAKDLDIKVFNEGFAILSTHQ